MPGERPANRPGAVRSPGRAGRAPGDAAAEAFDGTRKVEYMHRHRSAAGLRHV
ncbi:hypothetical protein [Streptosporangium sp. NPDC048865]|uniref:hypothetical protein n=1 Tax=Streptosporangium sp. NPDC048865 TaxID=3155766 RepID=UPI00342327DE